VSTERVLDDLEQLKQGDDGVADLFSMYRDRLKRIVRFRLDRRLLGRIDSDDVLQDAYIEVARRIQYYLDKPDVPFFIWVREITVQVLISLHRKHLQAQRRDARMEISLQRPGGSLTDTYSLAVQLVGKLTSPSQAAIRQERIAGVRSVLDQLEEIDRQVLELRHLELLTNNEVAEVLGIGKHAASKRYVRALQRLGQALIDSPHDSN